MEDTKSLLMMVLHKIFQNQPKTIENTFQLIHSFNNGKIEKKNYEKTLKTICDLMNDKLPSPILVYILTLVDMPQDFDSQSPIIEKMRRTHDFLPEINVRPHLLEYLNNIKPSNIVKNRNGNNGSELSEKKENCETITNTENKVLNKCQSNFIKPTRVLKRTRKLLPKISGAPKCLLDICAIYVVRNENALKAMYKKKQTRAWQLINNDVFLGNKLKQCYNVVKDLNRKMKWLREIESDNISSELLMEEYKNSDIFLKENQIFSAIDKDPFVLSEECEKAINTLLENE